MSSKKFSKLEKLHQFAAKGGIGTCVAIEDTLANSQIDLMFYTGEVITVLKQIDDDIYLGFCEGVIGRFKGKSVSFNGPLKTQLTSKSDNNNPTRKNSDDLYPDNPQRQFQQGSYLQPSNVGQNIQNNVGQNIQTRSRSSSMSSVDIISEPSSPPITPTISITYSNEDNQNYEGKKGSFNNHDNNNFSTPVAKNLVQSHVPQSNINNPSSMQNKSVSSRSPEIKSNPHNMNHMVKSREYAINPSVRQISTPTPPLSSPNVSPSSRQISTPTPPLSSPNVSPSSRQISTPTPPLSSPNVSPSSRQISTPTPPLSSNVSPSYRQISTPTPPLSSPNVSPSSRQISTPTPPLSSPNVYPSNPYMQSYSPNSPSPSQKIIPYNPSSRQFSSPNLPLSSPKPDPSNPSSYRQFSSPTPPLSSPKIDPSNPSSYRQFSSPTPPLSSPKIDPSNPSSCRQVSSPTPPLSSQKADPYNPSSYRQFSSPTPPPSSPKIIPSNPSARQFTTPNSPLSSPRSVPSSPLSSSKFTSNSPLSSPTYRQLSSPTSSLSSPKVVPQILVDDSELENRHKRFHSKKNYPTNDFDDDDSLYNSNNSSVDLPRRPMAPFMYENGNDSGTNDSEDISSDEDDYDAKSLKNIEPKKRPDSPKKEKVIAVDNYGFVHKVAENEIPEGANGIQRIVHVPGVEEKTARSIRLYRDRETKWVAFLGSMDPSMARDSRKIKKLVRLGIPESVRGKAWQFMAGVHKYRKKGVFDKLRNKEKLPIYDDIEKDIDRCYPDHIHFREKGFGQEDLFNILKAYAHYDTVVGYCQGMGRLVGMMLMQIPAEDTFWLLVATIEEYMSGYFSPDLPQIKVDSRIFDLLLLEHNPKLAQHFRNEGVDPILYIPKWFLTIFTMVLPWSSVLRIWDVFYFEGVKLFFRVGLAILDCTRDYILNHCPTISEILEFLGSIPHELLTPDVLLDAAFKIKLKRSTIKRLTKKASDKNESDKKLKIDGIEFKLIGDVNKN
ncbi:rab-GTPase-TBC domain-containing protein [Gigaspora rosea]|uniref:Rab-GTPase-TBC domain-containing protein n=1 Tax=Gigaspora rosea TaxID=44941 RepID=A0A397US86_9GLOM|nr:rab-GTPase-TBC domain-containing protein [Gigaspora rosea]